jgi:hypothetical protein
MNSENRKNPEYNSSRCGEFTQKQTANNICDQWRLLAPDYPETITKGPGSNYNIEKYNADEPNNATAADQSLHCELLFIKLLSPFYPDFRLAVLYR